MPQHLGDNAAHYRINIAVRASDEIIVSSSMDFQFTTRARAVSLHLSSLEPYNGPNPSRSDQARNEGVSETRVDAIDPRAICWCVFQAGSGAFLLTRFHDLGFWEIVARAKFESEASSTGRALYGALTIRQAGRE